MRVIFAMLAIASLPSAAIAQPAISVQEALLRAKPAVALVVAEVGGDVTVRCGPAAAPTKIPLAPSRETGTGWFVNSSGWLVTNAHVVSSGYRPSPALAQQRGAQAIQQACGGAAIGATADAALEPSLSVMLPNGFKLAATVVKYSAPPAAGVEMSGQDLALLRLEAADMPTLRLGDSADLQIGDRIHIVGFPAVVLSHELLNASAKMEASVTTGAVSGFRQDRAGQPVIQTDASAAGGNSGGPAVDERGDVIGVLTFVPVASETEGQVQGFNFVIPAASVTKFLEGTPVPRSDSSRFNAAWHAGLRQYFAGDYRAARPYLAEANRLLPELPDVRRVVADNDARLALQPWLPWRQIAVAMLIVSGVAYALLFARRWQRNRFRIQPTDVARLVDSAEPPVILDVRDAPTYARSPVKIPHSVHAPLDGLARERLPADPDRTVVAYCT